MYIYYNKDTISEVLAGLQYPMNAVHEEAKAIMDELDIAEKNLMPTKAIKSIQIELDILVTIYQAINERYKLLCENR